MAISLCLAKRLGRGDEGAAKVVTVQNVMLFIVGVVNLLISYPEAGKWQVGIAVVGLGAGLLAWSGFKMESGEVRTIRRWTDYGYMFGFRTRRGSLTSALILSALAAIMWVGIAVRIIVRGVELAAAGIGAWQVPRPSHPVSVQGACVRDVRAGVNDTGPCRAQFATAPSQVITILLKFLTAADHCVLGYFCWADITAPKAPDLPQKVPHAPLTESASLVGGESKPRSFFDLWMR